MTRIALLQPGQMGTAIGVALLAAGNEVAWLPEGRSAATAARAEQAGFVAADSIDGCDVVVSVVPPDKALETARQVSAAGFAGTYVDVNAISPHTAAQVAATVRTAGAAYVDGGIIGMPPARLGDTRLYLSGEAASEVAKLFAGGLFETPVLGQGDGGDFAASALKMAFGAVTKITSGLYLAAVGMADELGVGKALRAEWATSRPASLVQLERAQRSGETKGWRWEGEMLEIARTLAAAGQPEEFGVAAAKVFGRYPRPS